MIANFLFRNPRILLLVVVVIVVAGASSFVVMPRLEDPVLGRRVGVVSTVFPGASAERVESLVTIPIETALSSVTQVQQVRSNSQAGISNIVIELSDDTYDVQPVWSTIRNEMVDAAADLPKSCFQPELEVVPLKAFAAIIAVKTSNGENFSETRRFADRLKMRLTAISGTEEVRLFGDPGEEVLVEVSPTELAATGLSVAAIAGQLTANLENLPAGRLETNDGHLLLDVAEQETAIERVRNLQIRFGADEHKSLSAIAAITKQLVTPIATEAIIDDEKAIVLGVMVNDEIRVDWWADQMQSAVDDVRAEIVNLKAAATASSESATSDDVATSDETDDASADTGIDLSIEVLFSQRQHIDQRMETLLMNLGFGTTAVMLVVLLLMGWRSMIVVGVALPLSASLVLWAMKIMQIPVHQMSVTGLIVALGLLIDNAIVIVDDVRSRMTAGASRSDAIVAGVKHLATPLFGSTLTTAMAFLPIATLPGPPGEFVGTIAVSVILAILASFLLAMTVIPALVGLLNVSTSATGVLSTGVANETVRKTYEATLGFVIKRPILGVLLGTLLPLTGFAAAGRLPEQFFPPSDRNQIQIEVELPARDGIKATGRVVEELSEVVSDFAQVRQQYWFTGGSAPTFFYNVVPRRRGTPFYAQAFVDVQQDCDIGSLVRGLQSTVDITLPEARITVRQLEQGPPFDAPVELRIVGEDSATLKRLGAEIRGVLSRTENVIHTRSDFEETIPRLKLSIDDEAAREAGMNQSDVVGLLYTTLEGASAGNVFIDGKEFPVRVKARVDGTYKFERLAALPLPRMSNAKTSGALAGNGAPSAGASNGGNLGLSSATLASVATWELDSDIGAIVRIDGRRTNEIKAYVAAEILPSAVVRDFRQQLELSGFELPEGYFLEYGGETEQRSAAVEKLIANGVILFALMLLTLVASFQSFRCAFVIAAVGGLSAGLGPLSLSWFGYPLGFMAIVGTMGLVGIAINDSIVVLAAIRSSPKARQGDRIEIVQEVSHSTRHIIATTLTTIVGFLPLIIGGGGFWPPLAITIAGGVSGATFLALYFTPSAYLVMCGNKRADTAEGMEAIN